MIEQENKSTDKPAGIFKKARHIITGWARKFNIIHTPIEIEKLSKERLAICKVCDQAKVSKILELIQGGFEEVDTLLCTKCSCPVLEKSLVLQERCPLHKW